MVITDDRARLAEVTPTGLLVSGSPGQDRFPPAELFGGIPCAVSPHALLAHLSPEETDRLAVLAARLVDAVFARERPQLTLQASYDDGGTTPSRLRINCSSAGRAFTEDFTTR